MTRFSEHLRESTEQVSKNVYHGSNSLFKEFSQEKARVYDDFYGGGVAYFTENQQMSIMYAKAMYKKYGGGLYIYEAAISLSKCFDVDAKFTGDVFLTILESSKIQPEQFARNAGLLKLGSNKFGIISSIAGGSIMLDGATVFKGLSSTIQTSKAREILKKCGYDGLRYNGGLNMQQAVQHSVYLPYYAASIRIEKKFKVNVK